MEAGSGLVNRSGEALQNIMSSVEKVTVIVNEISSASSQQAEGINQVNQAISSLDELTQQNAALAEQTSAASISMNQHAKDMLRHVEFFQVDHQQSTAASNPRVQTKPDHSDRGDSNIKSLPLSHAQHAVSEDHLDDEEWAEF